MNTLPSLVKLDLSQNEIETMPHLEDFYRPMVNLEMLVLNKNRIRIFKHIETLNELPVLKHLSLTDNPITEIKEYRFIAAGLFPQVVLLD